MILTCMVIDDEPLAVELLEGYVRKTPFLALKGSYCSATAAFAALQERPVDLLFCDIQMPGLSGMDLARLLPEHTRIVFTTAFSSYAVEGFRVNALDYLLKPISYTDFLAAADKALRIPLDDILYIEGLKDYVKIYLKDAEQPVLSLMNMKSLEEELPSDRFIRVHRSFIVQPSNMSYIERGRIVFGKVRIPVSDTCRQSFQDFLSAHSIYPR